MFCNDTNGYIKDAERKLMCVLRGTEMSPTIYKPINSIPYNFTNNLDNNVLYTINPNYTQTKLKQEKQVTDSVSASNGRIIHSNFDKDIDLYKITKRVDTLLNTDRKTIHDPNYKPGYVKKPEQIPKNLKMLTRVSDNHVLINWNIPILPKGFYPDKIMLEISKHKNTKPTMYSFEYNDTPCEIKNDLFTIKTIKYDDRIMYTLTTDRDLWWSKRVKCFTIFTKVYFLFKYYDDNRLLKECFLESNQSSFYKN